MLCIPFICTVSWFFGFCLLACFLLCRCFLWLYLWFPICFVFLRDTCHPHACCPVCICLFFSYFFLSLFPCIWSFSQADIPSFQLLVASEMALFYEWTEQDTQAGISWPVGNILGYCFLKMLIFLKLTVGQQLLYSKGMPALFIFPCTVSWKNTFLPKNWRGMY